MKHRTKAAMSPATGQAAMAETGASKTLVKTTLSQYRKKAQFHLRNWMSQHERAIGETRASYLARWRNDWDESDEGRQASHRLAPCLATFNDAARRELRLTARAHLDNAITAVRSKAAEIKGRDNGDSWEDQVLDQILDASVELIAREIPRTASPLHGLRDPADETCGAA